MAILSAQQIFSEDQAITASAASTNIIDLGASGTPYDGAAALSRDIGKSEVPLLIQVTEAFDNLTTLKIAVETDDNSGFSSATEVLSATIALADLTAGKQVPFRFVPQGVNERYVRIYYTVTGTAPTAGKVTAAITMGNQTNV